jgi:hypothetical protein
MPETPDIPEELPLADVAAVPAEATPRLSDGETAESAATAHVPETAKEHEIMLEVHPAHHAASSWKEFFIHIATIVLGLLIAVGLEQTVEYFRHRREVAEVREELRGERQANKDSFTSETTHWRWETAELENNLMVLACCIDRLSWHGLSASCRQHMEGSCMKAKVLSWILRPIGHCHTKVNRI